MEKYVLPAMMVLLSTFSFTKMMATEYLMTSKFVDGIYLSHEDFKNNVPSITKGDYKFSELENKNFFQKILYDFKIRNNSEIKQAKDIWGVCINGIPYINQDNFFKNKAQETKVKNHFIASKRGITFTRIAMIGHICILSFEGEVETSRNSYNVASTKFKAKKYLLKLSTGQVKGYNMLALKEFIEDDEDLYQNIQTKKKRKLKKDELIMEYVIAYNKNNPIFLN